jgi:hypothetical protein
VVVAGGSVVAVVGSVVADGSGRVVGVVAVVVVREVSVVEEAGGSVAGGSVVAAMVTGVVVVDAASSPPHADAAARSPSASPRCRSRMMPSLSVWVHRLAALPATQGTNGQFDVVAQGERPVNRSPAITVREIELPVQSTDPVGQFGKGTFVATASWPCSVRSNHESIQR